MFSEEKETVCGTVDSVIFQSDETGYTVCEIEDENGFPVVLVGTMPYICEGDTVTCAGKWTNHPTYGKQFKVDMYEKTLPTGEGDILRYLASGTVKGIGPKTAKKIVDRFGEDTFDVIENHHEWLAEIPGITPRKAADINSSFIEMSGARNVMMFCADFFGSATSMKIYKKWGGSAVDRIRNNPYSLCDAFSGIGFRTADGVAESFGIEKDCPARILAGINYTLENAAHNAGHTCLPEGMLISEAARVLSLEESKIAEGIEMGVTLGKLFESARGAEKYVYLARYRKAESFCASKLRRVDLSCPRIDPGDISGFITRVEMESGIKYAALQREAIASALGGGVMILTGGPGTGKTTIIKGLISIFESIGLDVALSAPTGRAAKRVSESAGCEAKTVHRLLEMEHSDEREPRFLRNEGCYLDEDVVIVDESSMLDTLLLDALLKALKPGARIIFIGDRDQLPSVGAGNVLADLIDSRIFRTVCLTEVFRQSEESRIITNAHLINEGRVPVIDNRSKDFFFLQRRTDTEIAHTVADLVANRLPKAYGEELAAGIQVITPSRKGAAGTESLNMLLQATLNPPNRQKLERQAHGIILREGDRVMQIKNNYDTEWIKDGYEGYGVFNGDIGSVEAISPSDETLTVSFDGRVSDYDFTTLDELEHAFAITVHKSQGSEYPCVIIPLYSCAPMLLTRNLLYTAVTRASAMVVLVGKREVLETMVNNDMHTTRYTGLCALLRENER
ncbi:MAG: ATP-dependent RecD-like DNA helicase [Ruminococcaceae bacterium]|nr:ATP-dependent RecD-like DNA helicase [Oscillospiraceae bacterium]